MISKEYKNDPVIPGPVAAAGEHRVLIPLWEVAHFDEPVIYWEARKAGIKSPYIAYRLAGHEYRQGKNNQYPVLVFAVLPITTPDESPEGWSWTGE